MEQIHHQNSLSSRCCAFPKRCIFFATFLALGGIVGLVDGMPSPVRHDIAVDRRPLLSQQSPEQVKLPTPILPPEEVVLGEQTTKKKPGVKSKKKKLHGRFLHITDIHPDFYYTPRASYDNACHVPIIENGDANALKRTPRLGNDTDDPGDFVGPFGAPTTNCDSPFALVNATFDWIKANLMNPDDDTNAIDFVIWTGDSARHDNDVQRPRTEQEILKLNEMMVEKMYETFGDTDGLKDDDPSNDLAIPVVPTVGNNDILPHNIFLPGPNQLTREYRRIWRSFIPEDQYHVFDKGAYFWKDVVQGNKDDGKDTLQHGGLAVVSLNTMYFFTSNSAVDGCDLPTEPGYQQMEWLRIQLQQMRDTGMKAILIGHVPPARVREVGWKEGGRDDWESGWGKRSWDETCWRKYTLWMKQYRDVVVSSIYGHMNLDHFIVMDTKELERKHKKPRKDGGEADGSRAQPGFTINSAEDYLISLRESFERLPKEAEKPTVGKEGSVESEFLKNIGGEFGERFVISVVGPSVVPNYFPTLRIVEYNITGLVDHEGYATGGEKKKEEEEFGVENDWVMVDVDVDENKGADYTIEDELRKRSGKGMNPSKKNPNKPKEPVPNPPSATSPPGPAYSNQPFTLLGYTQLYANLTRINQGRKKELSPPSLEEDAVIDNEFRYELEYNTRNDEFYKMNDLTVRSYLRLARRLVDARGTQKGRKGGGKKGKKPENEEPEQEPEQEFVQDESDEVPYEQEEDADDDIDANERKGKQHKGHRHRRGHRKRDRLFREFVNRAFVLTVSKEELDDILGLGMHVIDPIDDGDSEEHRQPRGAMGDIGRYRPLEFPQGTCRVGEERTGEDWAEVAFAFAKEAGQP